MEVTAAIIGHLIVRVVAISTDKDRETGNEERSYPTGQLNGIISKLSFTNWSLAEMIGKLAKFKLHVFNLTPIRCELQ